LRTRTRLVKPSLFLNEDLARVSIPARYLFIGLWCAADREGRIEDRPRQIKAALYPYDDLDADALLTELVSAGAIRRYEVEGVKVVLVVNFKKHQKIHLNEAPSALPPEPKERQGLPLDNQGEPKERQGLPNRSYSSSSSYSYSSSSTASEEETTTTTRAREETETPKDGPNSPPGQNETALGSDMGRGEAAALLTKIKEAFGEIWPEVQTVMVSDQMITHVQELASRLPAFRDPETWRAAAQRARASSFLLGKVPGRTGKRFTGMSLAWFLKPDTQANIANGQYDDREAKKEEEIDYGVSGAF